MTGGAWLSSARVVKCRVKSRNERNPCLLLLTECLRETADQHRRKVWMMSSQHAPYILGYTRTTMVRTMSCDPAKASQSQKPYLSSDCTLQLECMKGESLVIAGQLYSGEYVPGSCTHCPSHHGSRLFPKSLLEPIGTRMPKAGLVTGVKSYQGSRTGRCGWNTSFLKMNQARFSAHLWLAKERAQIHHATGY